MPVQPPPDPPTNPSRPTPLPGSRTSSDSGGSGRVHGHPTALGGGGGDPDNSSSDSDSVSDTDNEPRQHTTMPRPTRSTNTRKPIDVQKAPKYHPRDDGHSYEIWTLQFLEWFQVTVGLATRLTDPRTLTEPRHRVAFANAVLIAMAESKLSGDFKVQGTVGDGYAIWDYLRSTAESQGQWNCIDLRDRLRELRWKTHGTKRSRADDYFSRFFEIVHTLDLKGEPLSDHEVRDIIVQNLPSDYITVAPDLLALTPLEIKDKIVLHAGVLGRMRCNTGSGGSGDLALGVFCKRCQVSHPWGEHASDDTAPDTSRANTPPDTDDDTTRETVNTPGEQPRAKCPACRRRSCKRGDKCPQYAFIARVIDTTHKAATEALRNGTLVASVQAPTRRLTLQPPTPQPALQVTNASPSTPDPTSDATVAAVVKAGLLARAYTDTVDTTDSDSEQDSSADSDGDSDLYEDM
eukprot:m.355004 g.355004  ORF g.355004 m.355004 type:complete len:462 (+) comp16597_c1_seq8:226-1611(+)